MTMTTTPTTRDELRSAFAELRRLGYAARMNFMCCSSCACYAIAESGKSERYVFWNRQSDEAFTRVQTYRSRGCHTGILRRELWLQWAGDRDEIAAVLAKHVTTAEVVVPENISKTFIVRPTKTAV